MRLSFRATGQWSELSRRLPPQRSSFLARRPNTQSPARQKKRLQWQRNSSGSCFASSQTSLVASLFFSKKKDNSQDQQNARGCSKQESWRSPAVLNRPGSSKDREQKHDRSPCSALSGGSHLLSRPTISAKPPSIPPLAQVPCSRK